VRYGRHVEISLGYTPEGRHNLALGSYETACGSLAKMIHRITAVKGVGKQKGADGNNIVTQGSQTNIRARKVSPHQVLGQSIGNRFSPRLTYQRETAPKDHHLRMEQMHDMRKREGERARGFVKNTFGRGISSQQRRSKMPGFPAWGLGHELAKNPRWKARAVLTHLAIHSPPRANVFNRWPERRQTHVPEFSLPWRGAMINPAVDDQPAADSTPGICVKDRAAPHPGSMPDFSQRRHIGVVIDRNRGANQSGKPGAKIHLVPAIDLMRTVNSSIPPINGTAKPHTSGPPLDPTP